MRCHTLHYLRPSGCSTLSLAALPATSPPLCNANAPMIEYTVCANTVSIPLPCKLSLFLGFHLTTLSTPYVCASFANRVEERTWVLVKGVMLSMPERERWVNASLLEVGGGGDGARRSASEVWRSRMRLPRKARRSLKPRRPWSKDLWVIASH